MDDDDIEEYLIGNSTYHCRRSAPFHSFPCSVWDTGTPCIDWESLRNHGLFPMNWFLITQPQESYGSEEGSTEKHP